MLRIICSEHDIIFAIFFIAADTALFLSFTRRQQAVRVLLMLSYLDAAMPMLPPPSPFLLSRNDDYFSLSFFAMPPLLLLRRHTLRHTATDGYYAAFRYAMLCFSPVFRYFPRCLYHAFFSRLLLSFADASPADADAMRELPPPAKLLFLRHDAAAGILFSLLLLIFSLSFFFAMLISMILSPPDFFDFAAATSPLVATLAIFAVYTIAYVYRFRSISPADADYAALLFAAILYAIAAASFVFFRYFRH